MIDLKQVQVGVAGWSNPPAQQTKREPEQTHLAHYAAHFCCVEINSSFYRPHQADTYARWRDTTPPHFRFSVKMPRAITHESHLRRCAAQVSRFYEDIAHLQHKLSAVLVQLPPSLEYDARTLRSFFRGIPAPGAAKLVCEPRHPSWFTPSADKALRELGVSRVAADPSRHPGAQIPGGARQFAYFRWHGTPHLYYSKYSEAKLADFAATVLKCEADEAWCIFDNTARHAAWDDALQLIASLERGARTPHPLI